jgi:dual specificity protein kinase YAK1
VWFGTDETFRNPPSHLLENGKQTHDFFNHSGFDAQGRKQYVLKSMEQYSIEKHTTEQPSKQYFKQTKLRDIIMEYPMSKKNPKQSDVDKGQSCFLNSRRHLANTIWRAEMAHRRAFVDFVEGLLCLDPLKRWTPQQAAKHPFITGEKFTGTFHVSL